MNFFPKRIVYGLNRVLGLVQRDQSAFERRKKKQNRKHRELKMYECQANGGSEDCIKSVHGREEKMIMKFAMHNEMMR